MLKRMTTMLGLSLSAALFAVLGLAGSASAGTNSGGSGDVNASNPYDAGVTATWSRTDTSNNNWNIVNATITTTGGYGWHQTYTLTEKQRASGGAYTVTGTVYLWTPYGSYTEAITPLTVSAPDVPFGDGVTTQHTSAVGAALLATEIDIVYNVQPAGVNADYWWGY